jgi:hypothetical protein
VTTVVGQTIKISGSTDELGNWDASKAVALSADQYTSANPLWRGTVSLKVGTAVQYKFIKVESSGSVTVSFVFLFSPKGGVFFVFGRGIGFMGREVLEVSRKGKA